MAEFEWKKSFPVMRNGKQIGLVRWKALNEENANRVHGQSLLGLAKRGGLNPEEIFINVNDLHWGSKVDSQAAEALVKRLEYVA